MKKLVETRVKNFGQFDVSELQSDIGRRYGPKVYPTYTLRRQIFTLFTLYKTLYFIYFHMLRSYVKRSFRVTKEIFLEISEDSKIVCLNTNGIRQFETC